MARESAREMARRQRERAERLARSAEAWERGADGEAATARALDALPPSEWTVFHDVRWPGRQRVNIDHVAVGPGGVFVIDAKNWSGSVRVDDNALRQNGRQRETAVVGAAQAGLAIARMATTARPCAVTPVLCFVRDEPITGWARDVMVCSTANIVTMLTTRPVVFDAEAIRATTTHLDLEFRTAAGRGAVHLVGRLASSAHHTPRPRRNRPKGKRRSPTAQLLGFILVALLSVPRSCPSSSGSCTRQRRLRSRTSASSIELLARARRVPHMLRPSCGRLTSWHSTRLNARRSRKAWIGSGTG